MSSHLQKKPFLDYRAQIKHLKTKQLHITDEIFAASVLEKTSYYGLINGYKDIIFYFLPFQLHLRERDTILSGYQQL